MADELLFSLTDQQFVEALRRRACEVGTVNDTFMYHRDAASRISSLLRENEALKDSMAADRQQLNDLEKRVTALADLIGYSGVKS